MGLIAERDVQFLKRKFQETRRGSRTRPRLAWLRWGRGRRDRAGSVGASAPGEVVMEHLGFTVARVVERARVLVRPKGRTRRQVRDYQRTARR